MPTYDVKIEVTGSKVFRILAKDEDQAEAEALKRVEWEVPESVDVVAVDVTEVK
jgi:hypothetical protein